MRYRGMWVTMLGAALLLLSVAVSDADAQRGRIGVLRPPPRLRVGIGARPRLGVIAPNFINTCFVAPPFSFFPFFGTLPLVNVQIFTGGQPAPDPSSHPAPDPNAQPVPVAGSQPVPGLQPVPEMQPVPGASAAVTSHATPVFTAPVYSAPVYRAPVYAAPSPVATPQVSGGMVIGEMIDDPTFGFLGSPFWFGGVSCVTRTPFGRIVIIR